MVEELSERIWLRSYRRLGYFPKLKDAPDAVVEPVRDALNFPASVAAEVDAVRTAKRQRDLVRKRFQVGPLRTSPVVTEEGGDAGAGRVVPQG